MKMAHPDPDVMKPKPPGYVRNMIHLFSSASLHKGSEPSLTSRNGQSKASSVDLSKRTLHSDDAINGTTPVKVQVASIKPSNGQTQPENHVTSNYVTSRIMSIESGDLNLNTDEVDSHRIINVPGESPKTPSYLKLSCAISGYNKYNSYNNAEGSLSPASPQSNNNRRIQVKRASQDRETLTPVDCSVHNGHIEGHRRSNGIDLDLVQQNGSHSNCSNGAVDVELVTDKSRRHSARHSNIIDATPSPTSPHVTCTDSLVVNGVTENGLSDLSVTLRDGGRGSVTPPLSASPKNISTPNKDGAYFLQVTDVQERRLKELCVRAEQHLQSNIPEEASGRIRAAIGKANLLTSKKFKQFRGLCNQNLSQSESEPFRTTAQDLAGFWDMVLLQVDELSEVFDNLEVMKQNGWNSPVKENQTLSTQSSTHVKTPRGKSSTAKDAPAQTPKSNKGKDSAKSRAEARKRLLAAKRAGRQRKASQSDDVEIFVS